MARRDNIKRAITVEEALDLSKCELVREVNHTQHRDAKRDKRAQEKEQRVDLAVEFFTKG